MGNMSQLKTRYEDLKRSHQEAVEQVRKKARPLSTCRHVVVSALYSNALQILIHSSESFEFNLLKYCYNQEAYLPLTHLYWVKTRTARIQAVSDLSAFVYQNSIYMYMYLVPTGIPG